MIDTLALSGAIFVAGVVVGRRSARDRDDRDAVDRFLDERESRLRERYTTTGMDYVEFAERVAVIEDPETPRIMRDAVDTHGIGPAIAFRIAREFDGYDEYQSATVDELASVHRVGDSRARDLVRE